MSRKVIPFIQPIEKISLPSSWAPYEPHMNWPAWIYGGRLMSGGLGKVDLAELPVSSFDTSEHRAYFERPKREIR